MPGAKARRALHIYAAMQSDEAAANTLDDFGTAISFIPPSRYVLDSRIGACPIQNLRVDKQPI